MVFGLYLFTNQKITHIMAKVKAKKDAAKSLDELFESCLKDAYWAEKEVKKALPKMVENATSSTLKKA